MAARRLPAVLRVAALVVVGAVMMVPFLWIISTSLRLPRDSFSLPPALLPTSFELGSYAQVLTEIPFLSFFWNSLKIAAAASLGNIIISSMAAYAFARLRFPGRGALFALLLSGLMISSQVTVVPQFILLSRLHLINTDWAIIILWLVNPLGIFLIRQLMMGIPGSYEEAAYMDGANRWWVFSRVILPMSMSAVAVSTVMWFVLNWNDFFRPLIFLTSYARMTIPLGMTVLTNTYGTGNISAVLAGVTLSLLPGLLIYIGGQRYLVKGLMIGGIKS